MRIIFLLFAILAITSSCNRKIKETIGIVTTGPNEYKVQRNKPLEVPPNYDLPAPKHRETEDNTKSLKDLNEGEKALINEIER